MSGDDHNNTTETIHRCAPKGLGLMPCCHRTPFEVPRSDRVTMEAELVTCARGKVSR